MSAGCLQQGSSLEPYELTHSFPVGIEGRWGSKWSLELELDAANRCPASTPRWMYHFIVNTTSTPLKPLRYPYKQFETHRPREAGGEDPTKYGPKCSSILCACRDVFVIVHHVSSLTIAVPTLPDLSCARRVWVAPGE